MITAVHQIQYLADLGLMPRDRASALIEELEAVEFGTRSPGSLRHRCAQFLCGSISRSTYVTLVRTSQVARGLAAWGMVFAIALIACLRNPGSILSRDMALPSLVAIGMGALTTALLHLRAKPLMRRDEELRRVLETT